MASTDCATTGNGVKVTLVRPPILKMTRSLSSFGVILPIGIAYVAAVLRREGHRLQVIDAPGAALDLFRAQPSPIGTLELNGLNPAEIVERIDDDSQVIGISHMFLHEWPMVREIAERARARFPHAKIVLGGENATAYRRWIFQQTEAIDCCVLGEGELTMAELVRRVADGEPLDDLQGIATRHGRTAAMPEALSPRAVDVDAFPRPAWDLFPVEDYMNVADTFGVNRGRSMPMLATRGCPYQCTFCSSPDMWTTRYLARNAGDVIDEMASYVQRYGVENINFCDLTAFVKRDWALDFVTRLRDAKLDISWQLPAGTRSEALDHDVLKLAYETGCRNITYAPESGSSVQLGRIKKKVKIPRLEESLKTAHKLGIVTRINLIIGHPHETPRDLWESYKFLVRAALSGCRDASVMVFAPYPGSADFEELWSAGRIELTPTYHYAALVRSGLSSETYNAYLGTRALFALQYFFLVSFYLTAYASRPWRFLDVVRSLLTGREVSNLDTLVRVKVKRPLAGVARRSLPSPATSAVPVVSEPA